MNAVISGRAGRALLLDRDSLKSFDVDDPSKLAPRRQSDLPYFFGEAQDLRIIENSDVGSIRQELEHDFLANLALDLTLISLDAELPEDIRSEAIRGLDELLADSRLVGRLENILYACPLPEDADLLGALRLSSEARSPNTFALLQRFQERQPLIFEVSGAWNAIPTRVFGRHDEQAEFQHVAVLEGLFRDLVTRDQATISAFLLNAGLNSSIKQLHNYRQVLQHWAAPFHKTGDVPKIKPEIEEEVDPETSLRRSRGRRIGIDRPAVLRKVQEKKAIISGAMQRRDLPLVRDLVDDLVSYQLGNGETEHAAKSLCDLAIGAKELGMQSLQLEFTERSINIAPDDYWSWAQYGDALLSLHRLDEALEAYQQSENFGAGVLARTGKGEALRAKGALDAALAAFNEVISEHPEDVFAKNGRAEVLKAMGQFDAALAAFDEVISEHPENVVAKTGHAEVLKAMGQFDAALAAFDETISRHPEDVVAKSGRAEVLKAMGQFDAALAAFDETISEHPENVVAKTGRAEVLKAMGQFDAALAAFDEVIGEHPEDVFARNGRAEVLKAMGQFDAALAAFDETISEHPEDVFAKNGRAEVLKAMGQLDDALAAYNEVILIHGGEAIARNGRSCVLAALSRYDEALEDLSDENPVTLDDWIGYHIRGMILLVTGKTAEAIQIFSEGVQDGPWFSSKEYFRTALAVAWLRGRDFKKASKALEDVKSPLLQPAANVLRLHAFGALGNLQRATAAYESLSTTPHLFSSELTQELRREYLSGEKPSHDEDWVFDREVKIFLLAA